MQLETKSTAELSEARRALLQRYLRGEIARSDAKPATMPKRKGSGPAPLSYSQQQIWLHSQLAGESLIYNEPVTIHRRGELGVSALERSFTEIVRRHEAWRTTFEWEGDHGVQIIQSAPARIEIPFIDLRTHPNPNPDREALRLATEDARRPFDLAHGPMYRLRLVRLGDAEHRLFLTLHHIIFDGVSLYRVLLPELVTLYEAFAKGESPQLPELPIQYPDYAVWQRDSIKEIPLEHFSYWQTTLSDLPVLDLKTDHRRPLAQTYAGAMEIFHVSTATSAVLKVLSQEQGATSFMTMVAAFMALLHDCTGQEDIVIGGISSGRNRAETQGLLGCFLNTIPIRCAFLKDRSFIELLAKVRTATLGALFHDEVPFELLVQEFARKRDPSRAPLFQVLAVVEPPMEPLPEGWDFTHLDVETGTAKFDLQLGLDDRPEGLMGCFIYNTDLFERKTIEVLKSRWLKLLERIAAAPGQRVSDLLQDADKRPMPSIEWNGTRTNYPRDAAIHHVFEEQAQYTPSAAAVVFQGAQLSYDELNRRANRLARRLQKLGVSRDMPVGVWMERSPEMVIALLAILKAGGTYVPLDPSYPAERLAFMREDTAMAVILTQERLGTFAPSEAYTVELLRVDADRFADEDDSNLANNVRAEDLAYVMYTSGSTGTPKGVAVTHRGVVRLVKETDYASFSPNETFLQLAPISFDASTFEIWGALLTGGKLVVMSPILPTLEEIGRVIAERGVTTLWLTAGLFNAMVDERVHDLRPLRQLLAGGDVLSVSHVRKALSVLKNTRLINGYGPTESTTFACCHTIDANAPLDGPIPIGKPIANTTTYILDSNLQLVPVGVSGELCIGGDGLARGYWRGEELTAEKFIADPFSREPGARLYRTGDIGRWRNDGVIEFLGRLDNQIKLRGFRIEPGEIETTLKQQPRVLDCVVVCEDTPSDKRLVAYVVGSASQTELLPALGKTLPDYMVPSAIVTLPALPRTRNDKLDRNALLTPAPEQSTDHFAAPKTPLEEELATIWAAVLGLDRVGTRDNFFNLGGHSLAGLRVVNQLSEALGERLSPVIFFKAPTVDSMAELLWANHPAAVARWIGRSTADGTSERKLVRTPESVRPYLGLQIELIAIWEEILGLRGIGIRDNFFELAGNSPLAQQMLQRAEGAFGKAIPMVAFAKNPTVEYLAAELARQAIEESPSLLRINDNGTRTPFFYLHGDLSGGGFYSLKLSRALGPDQPFYVLPPQDVRMLPEAPSIEEMAAAHLQALRAVRSKGPYIIGGFCLGGMVAYELAQQIAASGDTVEMLLVIDAAPEDKGLRALRRLSGVFARLLRWDDHAQVEHFGQWSLRRAQLAIWYELSVHAQIRLVVRQIRNRFVAALGKVQRRGKHPVNVTELNTELSRERDMPLAFIWAAAGYRPRRYAGSAAVLLSEDLLHRGDHLAQAWQRLASKVTVHPLKGRHLECITVHVDTLAGTIDRCLQGVVARPPRLREQLSRPITVSQSMRK